MAVSAREVIAVGLVKNLIAHLVVLPSFKDGAPANRELGGIMLRQLLLDLRDLGFIRTQAEYDACMAMIAAFEPLKIT